LEQGTNLVPAIVNLLDAIPDSTPVDLSVQGGTPVVRNVVPPRYNNVVLQTAKQLKFQVAYHCPLSAAGRKFPIKLRATTDNGLLATATTSVQCRDIPKKPPPPPIIVPLLEAFAPLVIPPPPPPPPPVSTISQAQAQSQAQVQGGAAFQEEKQPQAAFVNAYDQFLENQAAAARDDDDYAMTSYKRRSEIPAGITLGAGIVLMSFMYGFVTFAKDRVRVQRVTR
jgi:hypothetical protein